MRFYTRILSIETAPPGWNNAFLLNAEPWYSLDPIAVWAEVAAEHSSEDHDGPGFSGTYVMGLSQTGINEVGTPASQPWYEWSAGYRGMVHDDEITLAVKHAWEVQARLIAENSDYPWEYLSRVGKGKPRTPDQLVQLNALLLTNRPGAWPDSWKYACRSFA